MDGHTFGPASRISLHKVNTKQPLYLLTFYTFY
jgi:hypothetical protein